MPRRSLASWSNLNSTCPKSCVSYSFPVAMDANAVPVVVHMVVHTVADRNAVETMVAVEEALAAAAEEVEAAVMAEGVVAIAAGMVGVEVVAEEAVADMAPLAAEALAEVARAVVDLVPRNLETALRPRSAAQTLPIRRRVVTIAKTTRPVFEQIKRLFNYCHDTVVLL